MPPAFHGQDFPYTFYTGPNNRVANDTAAIIHQKFITNYAIHGEPGCEQGACFPRYGSGENALSMNVSEIKVVKDPWATERCDFLVSLMEFSWAFRINVGVSLTRAQIKDPERVTSIAMLQPFILFVTSSGSLICARVRVWGFWR